MTGDAGVGLDIAEVVYNTVEESRKNGGKKGSGIDNIITVSAQFHIWTTLYITTIPSVYVYNFIFSPYRTHALSTLTWWTTTTL